MTRPEDKTILVVDDEEDIREYLSTVLEDAGFNVVTAADGQEALERVEMSAPDFISLDLVMPRKSGNRFLYDLRKRQEWRDIPVVVVTSHAHDEEGKRDFEDIFSNRRLAGPQFHLEKPVNPEQYVSLICEKLCVQCEEELAETDSDRMRSELHRLVEDAAPSELSQILRVLKSMS
jgi:CheY-like chemotaxis protein